jgi:hypothetical protein
MIELLKYITYYSRTVPWLILHILSMQVHIKLIVGITRLIMNYFYIVLVIFHYNREGSRFEEI